MKRSVVIFCFLCLNFVVAQNQKDGVFEKITATLKDFKVNTTAVPEDQLTREIRKLRETKGGFNINEAISFKIGEDLTKGDLTQLESEKLDQFFKSGKGKSDLDNAVIWIYRDLFTTSEVRKLTKFYKSSAGQKLSENFPIVMLESLKAAEGIMKTNKMTK